MSHPKTVRSGCPAHAFFLLLCIAWNGLSHAGAFVVSPVRATLSATQSVAALTVRNDGDQPAVVQLEAVSWSQREGKDIYTTTREILATPPIFTVPAKATQVVRVGLRRVPDPYSELAYRLYLQEVPPPPKPGFQGLQVALRIGVPVFVLPPVVAKPVLNWEVAVIPDGTLKLSLENSGNAHVQLANFKLSLVSGAELAALQVAAYVLPGQSQSWVVKPDRIPRPGDTLHLFAQTDAGDIRVEIAVKP